jgi:hypothetical protein
MPDKEQIWFEMAEVRRRFYSTAVWIPLKASLHEGRSGEYGSEGFQDEYYGVKTLAVPVSARTHAESLDWSSIGLGDSNAGYVQNGEYIEGDQSEHEEFVGLWLVLEQRGNRLEQHQWHLHQDLAITLGLKRENDVWARPDEDYIEVVRLRRDADGIPRLLEIRADHLRDYLCARKMALRVVSYRQRVNVVGDAKNIRWLGGKASDRNATDRWEGRVLEIHEGGAGFGEKVAVFHVSRTDVDSKADVPDLSAPPSDKNIKSESWTKKYFGRKLFRISGELWRTEWVDPGLSSPIVRGDDTPPTVFFITDASGKQENRTTLKDSGKWLWFKPEVISALVNRRGGSLGWYTRDTGSVSCSPDSEIHFGINELGFVNAFADDIAILPEWQQRVWAGHNARPEGGVSSELLASQVEADPADTKAPEEFLGKSLDALEAVFKNRLGIQMVRPHADRPAILARSYRFRATDTNGVFALAKDLARLTADSFDANEIQKIVKPPKGEKWGTLKSLEKLLATMISAEDAHLLVGPLFGIYDLRLADAHLASGDQDEALRLAGVDQTVNFPRQGYQLLKTCVDTIYRICGVVDKQRSKGAGGATAKEGA